VTFPPGEYEAFRIDIGEAQGQNWWCVLYPPLCFVDSAFGVLPEESKQELKNILTEDEYNAITEKGNYRFKYLRFLNFIFE
jgi:stage II sporulation protein R